MTGEQPVTERKDGGTTPAKVTVILRPEGPKNLRRAKLRLLAPTCPRQGGRGARSDNLALTK